MAVGYVAIYDGLRSYYERREGVTSSPGFSAAAALSTLLCLNLFSFGVTIDVAVNRQPVWFLRLYPYWWAAALLVGAFILWLHVLLGKKVGVYARRGPPKIASWVPTFAGYALVSAAALVACCVLVANVR